MGWSNNETDELVIPPGAQDGEYRTIYGGTPPAELVAEGLVTVSRRVYTDQEGYYYFEGLKPSGSNYQFVSGWVSPGDVNIVQLNIYSPNLDLVQLHWDAGMWIGNQSLEGQLIIYNPSIPVTQSESPFRAQDMHIGTVDFVSQASNTGNIGAEAVVLTSNTINWREDRIYCIRFQCTAIGSANIRGIFRIRKTNLAGAILADNLQFHILTTETTCQFEVHVSGPQNADFSGAICVTAQASAGVLLIQGSDTNRFYLKVLDHGDSTDYDDVPKQIN